MLNSTDFRLKKTKTKQRSFVELFHVDLPMNNINEGFKSELSRAEIILFLCKEKSVEVANRSEINDVFH